MSDNISSQDAVSTGGFSQSPNQGTPANGNGSTNQDGAFVSVGDGSLQNLPPDPFTNPAAYGLPVPGQRLSEVINQNPYAPQYPQAPQQQEQFPQPQQAQMPPAQQQAEQFAIDERFAHLPKEEAIYRTWQSRYDRQQSELKQTKEAMQKMSRYETFLAEMMEDDQVFEAVVAERRPELIKPKDVSEQLRAGLAKEFGEDFEPDPEMVRRPGTKDWLYAKKAEDLYMKLTASGQDKVLPLKEVRALRLKQKEEQAAADQAEINAVKENLRWNDGTLEQFTAWAQSVKPIDLARLWQSMVMSAQYRAPFVQNHSGSPVAPNSAMAQIERLFG